MTRTVMYVLMLLALTAGTGCRDGLVEPEETIEPDAEPESPGCFELAIVLPGADAPYETRGLLANLIAIEARALANTLDEPIDVVVDIAADNVVARFPAEAMPALRPHVADAIDDAHGRF